MFEECIAAAQELIEKGEEGENCFGGLQIRAGV